MLETRKARRYHCDETLDCEVWGGIRIVFMRDLSLTGARLQGTGLPPVGTLIRVSPSFAEKKCWVFGQICWLRPGEVEEAGVRFLEPLFRLQNGWVGGLVSGKGGAERRHSIRVSTEIHMEMKFPGRAGLETSSIDLSGGGALVRTSGVLLRGERAKLHLCLPWCMVEVPAEVVRDSIESPEASLRFLQMSPGNEDALDCFLKEELAARETPDAPSGLSFLKLLNR